ncbi:MAG: oxidoreductase, partial [Methanomethylophilus sp.]
MAFFDRFKKKKKNEQTEAPKAEAKKEAASAAAPAAKEVASTPANAKHPMTYPAADLGTLLPGAPKNGKINIAIYWAAACGGCDVSILDTNERVLTIADMANIVMWPIAVDGKEKDIEAMPDK